MRVEAFRSNRRSFIWLLHPSSNFATFGGRRLLRLVSPKHPPERGLWRASEVNWLYYFWIRVEISTRPFPGQRKTTHSPTGSRRLWFGRNQLEWMVPERHIGRERAPFGGGCGGGDLIILWSEGSIPYRRRTEGKLIKCTYTCQFRYCCNGVIKIIGGWYYHFLSFLYFPMLALPMNFCFSFGRRISTGRVRFVLCVDRPDNRIANIFVLWFGVKQIIYILSLEMSLVSFNCYK